ncbi:hypothetical protein HZB94_03820 [Candidatus Falkowbacteria bacterium]|nr:hypothetical protein [Candidatus Falkowbacteria bacterium]
MSKARIVFDVSRFPPQINLKKFRDELERELRKLYGQGKVINVERVDPAKKGAKR